MTEFKPVTRNDLDAQFGTIWRALECYRADCIPEGQDSQYDDEWGDICSVMAWFEEDLTAFYRGDE
jgi:hypothetical protein